MRAKSRCAIEFDGIIIDNEIKDYMTINVEGRQLLTHTIDTADIAGRIGDVITGSKVPARDIKVYFLLKAGRNKEFLKKIKRLTEILYTNKEVKFRFNDEEGFRIGQVTSFEDPPYDQNTGIGSYIIHCSDPFIYFEERESTGKMPRLKYRKYPVKVESIRAGLKAGSKAIVRNVTQGTKIILNGSFTAGGKLVITDEAITIYGQNALTALDYVESDYHDFKIYSEDEIIAEGLTDLKIKYRECAL
ncbi:MAG: phage tail family protein [Eubacteriales bacterium]|uniref:distal tail protein Dit n=1 Tax=Fenollaria sp. TaxID=1965292 RepID=UPI002A7530ED|nr:distal tail protein Dit [Fenollaria sp.]MDD7339799.1 phage tail family protein [Eubacteriales bacterium]MDY3106305.1 phage tail family protein [Fenollaria sp.]